LEEKILTSQKIYIIHDPTSLFVPLHVKEWDIGDDYYNSKMVISFPRAVETV
jgi:hypothetical protein